MPRSDAKRLLTVAVLLYTLLWQAYWPGKAEAQYPVIDVASIAQIVRQIAETVELVQQGLANLMHLTNMGAVGAILAHVQAMMQKAQDIMDDLNVIAHDWNTLMDADQLPITDVQLFAWNASASGLMLEATRKAFRAMELLQDVVQLMRDAQQLFALGQSLAGNLAGLEMIAGQMTTLVNETVRAETLTAAYHQAMMAPVAVDAVNMKAAEHLARDRIEEFGVVGPPLDLR